MIVIAGTVPIRADKRNEAIAAGNEMVSATLAEEGCHAYVFSFDIADPNLLRIHELWEDQAALDAHFASPHMAKLGAQMPEFVAGSGDFTRYEASDARPLFG